MTGEAFLTLLHGLITPALAKHRRFLGLAADQKALLLTDAWTGFHSFKQGLNTARQAWSVQSFCDLPALQAQRRTPLPLGKASSLVVIEWGQCNMI